MPKFVHADYLDTGLNGIIAVTQKFAHIVKGYTVNDTYANVLAKSLGNVAVTFSGPASNGTNRYATVPAVTITATAASAGEVLSLVVVSNASPTKVVCANDLSPSTTAVAVSNVLTTTAFWMQYKQPV